MEIIRKGLFVILTSESELKNQLLGLEKAGRTCYHSEKNKITEESANKFIRAVIKRGHESVIEHSILSVKFTHVSRGFTHEMVRHRLCNFSQESTRYVDYGPTGHLDLEEFGIRCSVPPHRNISEDVLLEDDTRMSMADMLHKIEMFYRALRKAGWPPEDARQILPIAINADIVVTANFREWRHIFEMRTQKTAHWEIRQVMGDLLEKLKEIIPVIFEDFIEADEVDKNDLRYFEKIKLED